MPFARFVARDRSLGRNSTGTRNSLLMSSRFLLLPFPQGAPFPNFLPFSDPGTVSSWLKLVITSRSYRAWTSRNLASCVHSISRTTISIAWLRAYTFVFTRLWAGSDHVAIYGPSKDYVPLPFSLYSPFFSYLFFFLLLLSKNQQRNSVRKMLVSWKDTRFAGDTSETRIEHFQIRFFFFHFLN